MTAQTAAREWTLDLALQRIAERGCVVSIGQLDARLRRQLDKLVASGEIAKWRACWNAPLGGFGLGQPRTIYGRPELNPHRERVPA